MFGIGGGELIFIMFIVLMLFGSDKVPEIARTMGKAMAQLKNATNDIKSEIQKGAEANGFDAKSLTDMTGNISSEINKAKENLLGEAATHVEKAKEIIDDVAGPIKRQM
jgi:sec-independent protein translocase protein TatA